MGYRGRTCGARRGRWARYGARGRTFPLWQARFPQRQLRGAGPGLVPGNRPGATDYARLVTVPAIWGGTFVAGKIVVASLTPLMGSFARYVVACVALLVAALALEGGLPRLTARQWLATFVLGLFGVFAYNLFFMGALTKLPASRAALIIALNPAITIAISAVALKERLSARRWAGVMLALLGVAIVVSRGDLASFASGSVGTGELYMFAAVS